MCPTRDHRLHLRGGRLQRRRASASSSGTGSRSGSAYAVLPNATTADCTAADATAYLGRSSSRPAGRARNGSVPGASFRTSSSSPSRAGSRRACAGSHRGSGRPLDRRRAAPRRRPAGARAHRSACSRCGPLNDVGVVLVHRGGELVADDDAGGQRAAGSGASSDDLSVDADVGETDSLPPAKAAREGHW